MSCSRNRPWFIIQPLQDVYVFLVDVRELDLTHQVKRFNSTVVGIDDRARGGGGVEHLWAVYARLPLSKVDQVNSMLKVGVERRAGRRGARGANPSHGLRAPITYLVKRTFLV